jgi:hypothetical protein
MIAFDLARIAVDPLTVVREQTATGLILSAAP